MSKSLDDLDPVFRPKAVELIAKCAEAGIAVLIIDTLRSKEEQAENLQKGVSWTMNSKHLTGKAIDIAPYEQYFAHGAKKVLWNAGDPVWLKIGLIGEMLGLKWGGRWKQKDLGHFELA